MLIEIPIFHVDQKQRLKKKNLRFCEHVQGLSEERYKYNKGIFSGNVFYLLFVSSFFLPQESF